MMFCLLLVGLGSFIFGCMSAGVEYTKSKIDEDRTRKTKPPDLKIDRFGGLFLLSGVGMPIRSAYA